MTLGDAQHCMEGKLEMWVMWETWISGDMDGNQGEGQRGYPWCVPGLTVVY